MADATVAHVKELIHDQRHFSARWLRDLKARFGVEPETALMVAGAILGICLLQKDQGRFIANGILIAIPVILTYIYPKERPAIPLLLIYWTAFAASTLFDDGFVEAVPIYYILKLGAAACLFLRPFNGAQKIQQFLEMNKIPTGVEEKSSRTSKTAASAADSSANTAAAATESPFNAEELRELEKAKHKKSPPPEKPEGEVKSNRSPKTERTQTEKSNSMVGVTSQKQVMTNLWTPTSPPLPTPPPKSSDSSSQRKPVQSLYLPAPGEPKLQPAKTPTTSAYFPVSGETNPMLNDSNYRLTSTASATSVGSPLSETSVEGDKSPDDFVCSPYKKIVFNGPFDDRALTYHMTIQNNSRKWFAFAIKSNAIPRVTAMPPSGILKPGQKQIVAVTVQKFNYENVDASKDRIAFDYLFCPEGTSVFTHKLLQGTATRRRKNIKIEYNP